MTIVRITWKHAPTQDSNRDIALEFKLQSPWGTALAHSVHPTGGRLQWQTLASSSLGLASLKSDLHLAKREHMRRRLAVNMLAGSKLTSEEGSHARARAGKNKLANNGAVELFTADVLVGLKAGL